MEMREWGGFCGYLLLARFIFVNSDATRRRTRRPGEHHPANERVSTHVLQSRPTYPGHDTNEHEIAHPNFEPGKGPHEIARLRGERRRASTGSQLSSKGWSSRRGIGEQAWYYVGRCKKRRSGSAEPRGSASRPHRPRMRASRRGRSWSPSIRCAPIE